MLNEKNPYFCKSDLKLFQRQMAMMKIKLLTILFFIALLGFAKAQECGCTDPLASNYDSIAVTNDGSCLYLNSSLTPETIGHLPSSLSGTSSLIFWNGNYWSCNDHTKIQLYRIDTLTGAITDSLLISETAPQDMEEVAQDADYLYFGDFGNNSNTRTNLHILRVEKASLENGTPIMDTIFFSYPDQIDFTASSMQTDFDCEAFIVGNDRIYLFTKQWSQLGTTCYELPKLPGTYVAEKLDSCNVQGLVTGAVFFESEQVVILCGYSTLLQPFIYLLYDYENHRFFSGNKRKITINLLGNQVEAIAGTTPTDCSLTNEKFTLGGSSIPASLHRLNLKDYLANYLYGTPPLNIVNRDSQKGNDAISVFPNPANEKIHISDPHKTIKNVALYSSNGKRIFSYSMESSDHHQVNISQLNAGIYFVVMKLTDGSYVEKKIVVE